MRPLLVCLALLIGATGCSGADGSLAPRAATSGDRSEAASIVTPDADASTPESSANPFAFAVIGDFGDGSLAQLSVAARMCTFHESNPFDDVFTTGDNIYPSGREKYFAEKFFRPYACLFRKGVEWHASLGNHDWVADRGRPELDEPRFGMEGRNYVVREGAVRFVIANSNRLNRTWLRRKTIAKAEDRWTVVIFHHPVFSPGSHGSTPGLGSLADLFARRGVDLVLNGHDHFYASIKPQQGVRYIVTGGGGATLYPCLPAYFTDVCEERHHFLYVEAAQDIMTVTAVPPQGDPIDRIEIAPNDPG